MPRELTAQDFGEGFGLGSDFENGLGYLSNHNYMQKSQFSRNLDRRAEEAAQQQLEAQNPGYHLQHLQTPHASKTIGEPEQRELQQSQYYQQLQREEETPHQRSQFMQLHHPHVPIRTSLQQVMNGSGAGDKHNGNYAEYNGDDYSKMSDKPYAQQSAFLRRYECVHDLWRIISLYHG